MKFDEQIRKKFGKWVSTGCQSQLHWSNWSTKGSGESDKGSIYGEKSHFWNRTSINGSPPEIAPVHEYQEKSPSCFQLSQHKPKAVRAPRLRLRFWGFEGEKVTGRGLSDLGVCFWTILLVNVLEFLELEVLYRSLDLLLEVKLFFPDIVNYIFFHSSRICWLVGWWGKVCWATRARTCRLHGFPRPVMNPLSSLICHRISSYYRSVDQRSRVRIRSILCFFFLVRKRRCDWWLVIGDWWLVLLTFWSGLATTGVSTSPHNAV